MPVITQTRSTRTVVIDRARTAAIVQNRPTTAAVTDRRTANTVQRSASSVHVASPGPQGPRGEPGASGAGYDHQQPVASASWVINHNLGVRPNVATFDTGGHEFEADVAHTSDNQTVVTIAVPMAGYARLT